MNFIYNNNDRVATETTTRVKKNEYSSVANDISEQVYQEEERRRRATERDERRRREEEEEERRYQMEREERRRRKEQEEEQREREKEQREIEQQQQQKSRQPSPTPSISTTTTTTKQPNTLPPASSKYCTQNRSACCIITKGGGLCRTKTVGGIPVCNGHLWKYMNLQYDTNKKIFRANSKNHDVFGNKLIFKKGDRVGSLNGLDVSETILKERFGNIPFSNAQLSNEDISELCDGLCQETFLPYFKTVQNQSHANVEYVDTGNGIFKLFAMCDVLKGDSLRIFEQSVTNHQRNKKKMKRIDHDHRIKKRRDMMKKKRKYQNGYYHNANEQSDDDISSSSSSSSSENDDDSQSDDYNTSFYKNEKKRKLDHHHYRQSSDVKKKRRRH